MHVCVYMCIYEYLCVRARVYMYIVFVIIIINLHTYIELHLNQNKLISTQWTAFISIINDWNTKEEMTNHITMLPHKGLPYQIINYLHSKVKFLSFINWWHLNHLWSTWYKLMNMTNRIWNLFYIWFLSSSFLQY